MLWSPEEGVVHSKSPLTRQLPKLVPGCSLGGCQKEDAGKTGEAALWDAAEEPQAAELA